MHAMGTVTLALLGTLVLQGCSAAVNSAVSSTVVAIETVAVLVDAVTFADPQSHPSHLNTFPVN